MATDLPPDERAVVDTVRDFVDREVRPVARELEHADAYPQELIGRMKALGVFALAMPEAYGGVPVSTACFALVTEELARGWMSLAGAMGGHTVVCRLIAEFGTPEQRRRYLPGLAAGEPRATMALTEPGGGSDLQAIRTVAARDGDEYVVNGELSFADARVPVGALLGGVEGRGFAQMMRGLETGRIQVAARATGVGRAAFDDALRYARQRETFGQPIWRHQSIGNYLADMATRLTAARQLLLYAARRIDAGERADLEAGMAKLFCSETAMQIALDAIRIHGGYGYSTEFDVERYFRDAPLMIVGEGTNEIQRTVIVRQLIARGGL